MEQAELVARAQQGDRQAFDVLIMGTIDRLYSVARLILRDADLAEDATQEALIRCWRELPKLREAAKFDAWVRRLLVNAALDQFRNNRRFQASIRVLRPDALGDDLAGPHADRDQVRRGFERLGIEHRTILVLHHYLGLSTAEAATILGIPAGTAGSRLYYATAAMRAALEADARPSSTQEASA